MWLDNKNISINPWTLKQRELLYELAQDIANKYGIEKKQAIQLIEQQTNISLDDLKKEIWENRSHKESNKNHERYLDKKEIEDLFLTLNWAREVIENISKIEIKVLKETLEQNINIEDFSTHIDKYLPKKLLEKAKNPQLPHEHILWIALWSANSIYTTVDILYQIWKWILKAPYDIYIILSWKWETDSFKNI